MRCRPISCIHPSLRSLSAGSSGGRPHPPAPWGPARATSPSSDTPIDNTSLRMAPPARQLRDLCRTDQGAAAMSLDVEFARLIDATSEEVLNAFTDPEGQAAGYGSSC